MKHLHAQTCFFLLTILLSFNISAQSFVTVGNSASAVQCDYATIQDAIDSGVHEVRVLNNATFQENLVIDRSIYLKGGYQNCLKAFQDIPVGNNTQIDASQVLGLAAIRIDSTDNPEIRLYRLTLKNAIDHSAIDGGRGLNVGNSNGLIELFNVSIHSNTADSGAGIYTANPPGSLRVILNDSIIYGNIANGTGGGLFCANANTYITIQKNSGVFENQATNGGGIAAVNGCKVTVSSGEDARTGETSAGVVRNIASNNGGGVYANLAAEINFQGNRYGIVNSYGNDNKPATLADNVALNYGGGIYANNGSQIELYDSLVWDNSSTVNGGAFYLDEDATLLMTTSARSKCWDHERCSVLAENFSARGGALYQRRNSNAMISNSYIFENSADYGLVTYSRADGINGTMSQFHNNMIYQNGKNAVTRLDRYLLRGFEAVTMELIHNTIADNDINDSYSIIGSSTGAHFIAKNSIIYNSGEDVYSGSASEIDAECLLVNEDSSFSGTNIGTYFPLFVDPASHDYHIKEGSGAADMCASISGFTHDIDGELRGFDDPISNLQGAIDAGADETYASDIIFKDGFQ